MQDGGKPPPPWRSSSWRLVMTSEWFRMLQHAADKLETVELVSVRIFTLSLVRTASLHRVSIKFIDFTKAACQILFGKFGQLQGVASLLQDIWLTKSLLRSIGDFLISLPKKSQILIFLIFLVVQGAPEDSCPTELGACEVACAVLMVPGPHMTAVSWWLRIDRLKHF